MRNSDSTIILDVMGYKRPSEEFERMTGIKGISRRYTIPPIKGLETGSTDPVARAQALEYLADALTERLEAIRAEHAHGAPFNKDYKTRYLALEQDVAGTYRQLLEANPELSPLLDHVKSGEQAMHVIRGVSSGFTVQDMVYFIQHLAPDPDYRQHRPAKPHDAPAQAIAERTGQPLEWAPSPSTCEYITRQLDKLQDTGRSR